MNDHDALFRNVVRAVLQIEPTRADKSELLAELAAAGVFLIDLKEDGPVDGPTPDLSPYVPGLVARIRDLQPTNIVLIKADVYDTAYPVLAAAGLPVVNERMPFPGSGRQREFHSALARALTSIGWQPSN